MREPRIAVGAMALAVVLAACAGSSADSTTTEAESAPTTEGGAATTTEPPVEATTTEAQATTTAGASDGAAITIVNFNFSGAATVPVGTTVTATNQDNFGHTWTSDDDVFDSGTLSQGDSFEFTFEEPGEYPYFCRIHPTQMTGTITVTG